MSALIMTNTTDVNICNNHTNDPIKEKYSFFFLMIMLQYDKDLPN